MLLLDAPYVSEYLCETAARLGQPVLDTDRARAVVCDRAARDRLLFVDQAELARRIVAGERVLANSENSLDLVLAAAEGSDLARQIEVCKDKARFREVTACLYPDYRFARVTAEGLGAFDPAGFPKPFVIKPSRGFFSLGVHVVCLDSQWPATAAALERERATMNAQYPESVVDAGEFIVEAAIQGEEYAIDVYFDAKGEPVVTNILHHRFASEDDVSDRLYYTSPQIVRTWLGPFTEAARRIGLACGFHDFPMHLEVRVGADGAILPIEANPLRFAGWCVADITAHAWGFNPYECYLADTRPDWPAILDAKSAAGEGDAVHAMVIGDLPSAMDGATITRVDYDGFAALFDTVLELRRMDYTAYPVFAFVFAKAASDRMDRLAAMTGADFTPLITTA
ncbi:MAG: ATP-grasp domain-containing protein [Pseudodesulfovibrio sp.]|uniref:ATP-grasp domain-containing protein n=1 Tax=Pseudodesulfovibrio aespoeensis (strain ATCC 700646 / DSM 10631 / Aspo-2) TaxID=643562 RepID=E6VR59_PSEA9|nr:MULTISPECIES: ATP-grasp domain-containing protein [Pseudodesulfovibrio]MBU4243545.1 ATP-grasp domain-containing protein [Pseudomonadota bacterium]ADU64143.1 hypothetical protein Daes_3151 [Pseudodesulfovibrio aespoeensis Aspo-2]MBU4378789.1 ATP-grasp domain-containing protein [Pseudomonadota bacterium]MBU4475463.1 ATP-grasp domain-containing protein [Pseudomonadota bacterium]MBU4517621.1 ATP-grasp domain-containing protein [Pseudomonadota bacterium]